MPDIKKAAVLEVVRDSAPLHFTKEGWFNATEAAAAFGKRLDNWLRLDATTAYIRELIAESNSLNSEEITSGRFSQLAGEFITTRRGRYNSGTWLHPELAVEFARWLDVKFAIWCNRQIRQILSCQHAHFERQKLRHETAASFKVMTAMLQITRGDAGKATASYHYSNEARLVNFAMTGQFGSVDRDQLPADELDLLAHLEQKNTIYLGRGLSYVDRKTLLTQCAADWRCDHLLKLEAA